MAHGQGKTKTHTYVAGLAKKGGYGWKDQPDAHLTPTFAAIGILHHLGQLPADKKKLIEQVRQLHPQHGINQEAGPSGTEMRNLDYQQIQSLRWLGDSAQAYSTKVKDWTSQAGKHANFEQHGYPVFMQEMMIPVCRDLLRISQNDTQEWLGYIASRRRSNGSYNNAPAHNGGDGNILNTYWGVYVMSLLGSLDTLKEETIRWIQACQMSNGGFTHQPKPTLGANDDVAYTWAAIKSLKLLAAQPAQTQACIRYLLSLRNADGGFGKQPGLPSSPIATFYAIEALQTLQALSYLDSAIATKEAPVMLDDFIGLKVFTVQFQAPGTGSPAEAVVLADSLHIHLWGAKNAHPSWLAEAQRIADERKVPVTFFHANEDYGRYITIEGMGSFSHISDPIFAASNGLADTTKSSLSWHDYQHTFLQPLLAENGGNLLQITNNEPLARILLDESVKHSGYGAISTIHFAQNFLFFLPHLYQYRHQLPFVALQDAHGSEAWWWAGELTGYRTLFLAKAPTYQEMMRAMRHNWMVAVRHDQVSGYQTRMLGGATGVQPYVRSQQAQWAWWHQQSDVPPSGWAVITVLTPRDTLEADCPKEGAMVRIRCRWQGNRHILEKPIVSLELLSINHKVVQPAYVTKQNEAGQTVDSYYWHTLPNAKDGNYLIEATLRNQDAQLIKVKKTWIPEQ